MPVKIPQPPARLIIGNLPDLRRKATLIESLLELAREYGPLFQLQVPTGRIVFATGPDEVAELCDETRFDKALGMGLLQVRKAIGDGLFTAYSWEPNWQKAHRILMPPFSQPSMKAYVPAMVEIATQLMQHLDSRLDTAVDVAAEMTKLTLDTIALCGFSYRFDSFKEERTHPFIEAMVTVLGERQTSAALPPAISRLMLRARLRTEHAEKVMAETVDRIIRERRASGPVAEREDLLQHMLTGVDKKTGEGLPDSNIRSQCITFLVAGHETTSGLLSFAIYYLVKNPQVLARACQEVDQVLGPDRSITPDYDQIHALSYIEQVLKETLRIWPTAPAFTRGPLEDTLISGKYLIPKGQPVTVVIPAIHRAPSVWGDDPERFDPERFTPEAEAARPPNTYLPFGTGARACIGRQFALQEAKLVLGMLLHRFKLVDHTNYQLRVKQTLTIKPADFHIRLERRPIQAPTPLPAAAAAGPWLHILHGSNLGACEAMAHELAREAVERGYQVACSPLDDAAEALSPEGATVIVCSSYNGAPPDNAALFCQWLEKAAPDSLQGIRFALFGAGNREWANTYQKVPRRIDERLQALGAQPLQSRGEGDARSDMDGDFRIWAASLWESLATTFQLQPSAPAPVGARPPLYSVDILEEDHPNPFAEIYSAVPMVVVENRELQNDKLSGRSTRHLELALPEGWNYAPGDHLGVIPENSSQLVSRAAHCFGLTPQTRIRLHIQGQGRGSLPTDRILSVQTLLTHYVELQEVATRWHVETLARYADSPNDKRRLAAWLSDADLYQREVRERSASLLDLLQELPSVKLPFGHFLELVSPLRARYYSISSAPLACGRLLSITVGVVSSPARSGHGEFRGACSNYLAKTPRGQSVYAFLQDTHGEFRLPSSPSTPILMIGAGTGLAPYRGFLQERAGLKQAGQTVGRALLCFGCRHPEQDYLYRAELEDFQKQGVVEILTAFSRLQDSPKVYVQDRLREHGQHIWQMLEDGATIYVCGDAAGMSAGVRRALADIVCQHGQLSESQAQALLDKLAAENRYLLDVWASG